MLAMGGAAVAAIVMIAYAFFRPAENPEEIERKRRLHLNQIGRIAEGQVVELVAHPAEVREKSKTLFGSKAEPLAPLNPRQLVSYSYAISKVQAVQLLSQRAFCFFREPPQDARP